MQRRLFLGVVTVLAGGALLSVWLLPGASFALAEKGLKEDQFKPKWAVGDQWVIEAATPPLQRRTSTVDPDKKEEDPKKTAENLSSANELTTVRWQFTVVKMEMLGRHNCYRVEVVALPNPALQPKTVLWVDANALALRQMQTQVPVPGGFTTMTESYEFGAGQPAPVAAALTALPVDLPMFVAGKGVGAEQSFSYESSNEPLGKRAPNDVGFAVDIKQAITPVKPEQIKDLLPPQYTRDLQVKPVVEVKLKTAERSITQYWQASQPWPVYSNNGHTTARLVETKPAKNP